MIKRIIYLIVVFATICLSQQNKIILEKDLQSKIDSLFEIREKRIDSILIELEKYQKSNYESYQVILEKTNEQVSLWTNPYGIIISILAILFTLLTIVAAVIIFLQSRGFKENLNKFINSGKESLDKLVKEKTYELNEIDIKLKSNKEELEKLSSDKENEKAKIQGEIENLIEKRKNLKLQLETTIDAMPASGSLSYQFAYKCQNCGFKFIKIPFHSTIDVKCPKCGMINYII
jgi:rubrerythrin